MNDIEPIVILGILVKIAMPFAVLVMFKLVLKNHISLNISYIVVAVLLAIYLQAFNVAAIGLPNLAFNIVMSFIISIIALALCVGFNYLYKKLRST